MAAKARDTWKYFCGCCWTRIRKMQNRAAEIVGAESLSIRPRATIRTEWDVEVIDGYIDATIEVIQRVEPGFSRRRLAEKCSHDDSDCDDQICLLVEAVSLMAYIDTQRRQMEASSA